MWLITSIFLVRHLYKSKWRYVRHTPMSKSAYQIAGFLLVDDTDLFTMNKGDESASEVVTMAQIFLDR